MLHQIHCPRCQFFQQVDDTRVMPCQQCGLMLAAAPTAVPVAEVVERGYGQGPVPNKTPKWMIWTLVGAIAFFVVSVVGTFGWAVYREMERDKAKANARPAAVNTRTTRQQQQAVTAANSQQAAQIQQQLAEAQRRSEETRRRIEEDRARMAAARTGVEPTRRPQQFQPTTQPIPPDRQAAAEKAKNLDLSEYNKHWSVQGKVSANLVPEMMVPLEADGTVSLPNGRRMRTRQMHQPPVTFRIVAQTDSTNLRMRYAASQIIFNWEGNPSELRIDGGPANGRHKAGAGAIPANQWVAVELTVTKGEMIIRVDGEERYRTGADFSNTRQSMQIWSMGSTVKVRSVQVVEPADAAVER
jgi:hypothetical protein